MIVKMLISLVLGTLMWAKPVVTITRFGPPTWINLPGRAPEYKSGVIVYSTITNPKAVAYRITLRYEDNGVKVLTRIASTVNTPNGSFIGDVFEIGEAKILDVTVEELIVGGSNVSH